MNHTLRTPSLSLAVVLLATGCTSFAGRAAPTSGGVSAPPADARAAVSRSLAYLERDGLAWMHGQHPLQEGSACVSCHHVTFALWTAREAGRRGILLDESRIDDLAREAEAFLADSRQVVPLGQMLLARASSSAHARTRTPDDLGTAWLVRLGGLQKSEGVWEARGQFPTQKRPVAESNAVATYWTMLAIDSFDAVDEADAARTNALREARRSGESRQGETVELLATRLLVEHEMGDRRRAAELRDALLAAQRADGSWPWAPGQPGNAYSTGQALYALARIGQSTPAVRHGVAYLLERQRADGTWDVPSKLTSAEPSKAKDYIYTYWGTAWATLGLARTVPPLATPPVQGVPVAMQ